MYRDPSVWRNVIFLELKIIMQNRKNNGDKNLPFNNNNNDKRTKNRTWGTKGLGIICAHIRGINPSNQRIINR